MDPADDPLIQHAAEAFERGLLVAIPTETVYGLAAPINNPEALKKIFTVKERPAFDPLIIHVSKVEDAKNLVSHWPLAAEVLAKHFWPGPLTLVLPKSDQVLDLITSGLSTVAIRMPNHPLALGLIEKLKVPIAAPSANKFGKTSPTTTDHVRREFSDDEVYIIEGGPTNVGLESTILKIDDSEGKTELRILRPGMLSKEELSKVLTDNQIAFEFKEVGTLTEAPGQLAHHYMPRIPLLLVSCEDKGKNLLSQCSKVLDLPLHAPKELRLDDDPKLAARELYGQLRELSDSDADCIFFFKKAEHVGSYWEAIMDRITKASSVNLLKS